MKFSIHDIFISRLGSFNNGEFSFLKPYFFKYTIVLKEKNGLYKNLCSNNLVFPSCEEYLKYDNYSFYWGNITSIYPFLLEEEINTETISLKRIQDIYYDINVKCKCEDNLNSKTLKFIPKL